MVTANRLNVIIFFSDLILLIIALLFRFMNIESYNFIFVASTLMYVVLFYTWLKKRKNWLNFFTVILGLTYIYTFGQYLVNFLGAPVICQYNINNVESMYSNVEINNVALYFLINVILLHMFVVFWDDKVISLTERKTHRYNILPLDTNSLNNRAFLTTSMILLAISFVCEMLVLTFKIRINLTLGYADALAASYTGAGGFSHIINFASTLFIPSVFASLIATKGKKINIIVWALYVIYVVLYFMSGSRFEAIISLAGVVLVYHYYYTPISTTKLFLIILLGLIVIYACAVVSNIRIIDRYGIYNNSIDVLRESIKLTNKNNFIFDVISVTGMQVLTNTAVYEHCPADVDFSYGSYYLGGLIRLIPNIFGGENKLITASIDSLFVQYLTKSYGMGSSFVIEAYYNFGLFGVLMMFPYGYLIALVCKTMEKARKNKNIILTYFVFYISSTAMFYVRSDARMLVREIVYYYFGYKFLTWLVKNIFYKKAYK